MWGKVLCISLIICMKNRLLDYTKMKRTVMLSPSPYSLMIIELFSSSGRLFAKRDQLPLRCQCKIPDPSLSCALNLHVNMHSPAQASNSKSHRSAHLRTNQVSRQTQDFRIPSHSTSSCKGSHMVDFLRVRHEYNGCSYAWDQGKSEYCPQIRYLPRRSHNLACL